MIKPDVSDGRHHLPSGPLPMAWESLAALDTSFTDFGLSG